MKAPVFAAAVAAAMLAFAANSLLNRAAVGGGEIDALAFALWRVVAGAVLLVPLALLGRRALPLTARRRIVGALSLSLYLVGFSLAYIRLDAGLGALILFGGVQLTMFGGAVIGGDRVPARRWAGATLALAGLAVLVWPGSGAVAPWSGVVAMVLAAVGWGLYSLAGRGATDPLAETAANFLWAIPICLLAALSSGALAAEATPRGIALAVTSGAITSGLGYAIWYAILPRLGAARGGLIQLSVPVIAIALGALLLAEDVPLAVLAASALVIGGIALGLLPQRRMGSRGS